MPKPFANTQGFNGTFLDTYLIAMQAGTATGDPGLDQMRKITLGQLRAYVRQGFGNMMNFRGAYSSALPENPEINDYFYASETFTADEVTYTQYHFYEYNGSAWFDISGVLSQFCTLEQAQELINSQTLLKSQLAQALDQDPNKVPSNKAVDDVVNAISGGIIPKGDILSTDLPPASESNKGWQYYCTDLAKNAVSDGTQWVYFSNTMLTSTPDAADNAHALTNAAVTTLINGVSARVSQNSDRLNQHESRLENLEQKAGDYTTVQYRGTNVVPTGKAKYGLVKNFVGKSRAWNQLVKNGNFAGSSNWSSTSNGSLSVSSNKAILTANDTSIGVAIRQNLSLIQGHKYLISYYMTPKTRDGATRVGWNGINVSPVMDTTKDVKANYSFIFEAGQTASSYCFFYLNRFGNVVGDVAEFENINCYDITLIFGAGNEPSTVADALAQLPALGQYNAYDEDSLVSTEISGVKSVGVNIWDEEVKQGYYISSSDGTDSTNANSWCSKNYIRLSNDTTYYLKSSDYINARWYDANKNYLGYSVISANSTFNPTSVFANAVFLRFNGLGTTYKYDIQICLNSYADKTTYHPYMTDTLSLPTPFTGRSAGTVADTDELNVEVNGVARRRQIQRIGRVDLGSLNWTVLAQSEGQYNMFQSSNFSAKKAGSVNILVGRYVVSNNNRNRLNDKEIVSTNTTNSKSVCVRDDSFNSDADAFKTAMDGVMLNYELETPVVTLSDPIIDNFTEVEGDGTIDTIQEQSLVIDNCLDVGYLTV